MKSLANNISVAMLTESVTTSLIRCLSASHTVFNSIKPARYPCALRALWQTTPTSFTESNALRRILLSGLDTHILDEYASFLIIK